MTNAFEKGKIDQTLFIKRHKEDILHVQVYVDDIMFGSNREELAKGFADEMKTKFEMSIIGELNFYLGIQIQQTNTSTFIS